MERHDGYFNGNCDIMALALNRLTGLPFGMFSSYVLCDSEEGGLYYEDTHAVVVRDFENSVYIDAGGEASSFPENFCFSSKVEYVVLRPVSEEEVRRAFTTQPIDEEAIAMAEEYAIEFAFCGEKPTPVRPAIHPEARHH